MHAIFKSTRFKLVLQYKGTHYNGWQVQPNGITIQGVLQEKFFQIFQQKINIVGSGRTDSGVHALAQVCHVDLPKPYSLHKFQYGLNSLLPKDIAVLEVTKVPGTFHAQKSAKRKIYDYYLLNSRVRLPFLKDYVWHVPYLLSVNKMQNAAKLLVGEHDFKSFCAADSTAKTTVRRIYKIKIRSVVQGPPSTLIGISIEGNGFLKHMVRNIVGTLVAVGKGKMPIKEFKQILKQRDRRKAGMTAPAQGLILRKVIY